MKCERLQGLVKSWYLQVQDESMAPARMVSFMEKHLGECATCLADPLVRQEVDRIIAIVLPPVKTRKPEVEEEEPAEEVEEEVSLDEDDGGEEENGAEDEEEQGGDLSAEEDMDLEDEDEDDL